MDVIRTAHLHGLVSLMRDAGDDCSHTHQPDAQQFVGQPDGSVTADGTPVSTWDLDGQPCTHTGCRCLLRWLPDGDRHSWRAVATTAKV